jgi:RNA polymerase sigma-70 factor, ECF subfamily
MSVSRKCMSPKGIGFVEAFETADDDQVVAAAKTGDRAAFGELARRHHDRIFRTTLRIIRNHEDAEDAAQEAFISAMTHLESFDGRSRFSTWLTRIAINAALMRLRKNRASREVSIDEPRDDGETHAEREVAGTAASPEESYSARENLAILREAIGRLRPTLRNTVEIHHQKHGSLPDTAEVLGISMTAAKARLFRARAALRHSRRMKAIFESNWRMRTSSTGMHLGRVETRA